MTESDTISLLRECDAAIKMGIGAMDEMMDGVQNEMFRTCLVNARAEHIVLKGEIETLLKRYHDDGKEPDKLAKGMAWMKSKAKLSMDHSDKAIADLMTDGCSMGVKSLYKYLNQYPAADEKTKDIAKRLIHIEEKLVSDMRGFL